MSALHKMTDMLGLSQPAEDEYEQDYGQDYDPLAEPYAPEAYETEPVHASGEEDSLAPVAVPDLRRIVTATPRVYNHSSMIGEPFREGVPVVVNLTQMDQAEARRTIDFCSGLVHGLNGAIERITPRVYLLTPATVEIDSGEPSREGGHLFNQN